MPSRTLQAAVTANGSQVGLDPPQQPMLVPLDVSPLLQGTTSYFLPGASSLASFISSSLIHSPFLSFSPSFPTSQFCRLGTSASSQWPPSLARHSSWPHAHPVKGELWGVERILVPNKLSGTAGSVSIVYMSSGAAPNPTVPVSTSVKWDNPIL